MDSDMKKERDGEPGTLSSADHGDSNEFEVIQDCVHRLFERQVLQRPDAPAVYAWDVKFTYMQLDQAANRLAHHLARQLQISRGTLIHTCFEKTGWYIVAVLAINKAGAAWVPLDPSHPKPRKQQILKQTRATIALASPANVIACAQLGLHVVEVSQSSDSSLAAEDAESRSAPVVEVSALDAAYVLFTSGSTGVPKGIVMEHVAVCTSQRAISERLRMTADVRILQFSSFVFDVSVGEIIAPLISGACSCMPSEDMRVDIAELATFIEKSQTNWAFFTPTFAGLIHPSSLPTLELVALVGEVVSRDTFDRWFGNVPRLVNGWGPTETCVFSALHEWSSAEESPATIGRPVACHCWIVDPKDPQQLVPAGGIGEIVIQGPTLLREYLADVERTKLVIVDTPLAVATRHNSRQWGRCYLTGDLATHNADGSLRYCERKDTQVKIRGQRVELSDIESNIKPMLSNDQQVAVGVISKDQGGTLVAFVSRGCKNQEGRAQNEVGIPPEIIPFDDEISTSLHKVVESLETVLPAYMVPTIFLCVRHMPYQLSLKLDRQALRRAAESMPPNALAEVALSRTDDVRPLDADIQLEFSSEYKVLRGAWAKALKIDESFLNHTSHFFSLGGDSIIAMRLANSLRSSGFDLSAGAVLKHPRLLEMSFHVRNLHKLARASIEPFSLLTGARDLLITQACRACNISQSHIQDMYPCTPFQSGIMAIFAREPRCYVSTFTYSLRRSIDLPRYLAAWQMVHLALPILRTRIVLSNSGDYFQVVVNEELSWSKSRQDTFKIMGSDVGRAHSMGLGTQLVIFALEKANTDECYNLSLTMHHALYDGWSLTITMSLVERAYEMGMIPSPVLDYNIFVQFLQNADNENRARYWRGVLLESPQPLFPPYPIRSYRALDDSSYTVTTKLPRQGSSASTLTILCHVAWGLLLAKYENTNDVIFGCTLSGRSAELEDINNIYGPTLTTVPLRLSFETGQTISSLLGSAKGSYDDVIGNAHYGLSNIARLGPDERRGCGFRTIIIIQTPEFETLEDASADRVTDFQSESATIHGMPLTVTIRVGQDTDKITFRYDSHCLSATDVSRIVEQYIHILEALSHTSEGDKISDMEFCSPADWTQVLKLNSDVHERTDSCIHDLVTRSAMQHPTKRALEAWDGNVTYEELECLSDQLAQKLSQLGVGSESFVPLCFEKSKWAIVAMLGILKAGGAFVPLDPAHPNARLSMILEDLNATIAVTSDTHSGRLSFVEDIEVIVVNESCFRPSSAPPNPIVNPSKSRNAAYAMFTSGSTGRPKGFVVEHGAYCTGAQIRARTISRDENSRVLQFASYGFDPSIEDIMTTLIFGGCVCIPSSSEARESLGLYIQQHRVNFANLTPSFAATIDPSEVTCLETLLSSGEPMTDEFVKLWAGRVKLMNGYGPSETCIKCAINPCVKPGDNPRNIGHSVAANLWIVDPENPEQLAPFGAPGELMVEGPCLSRGYLRPSDSVDGFIEAPKWLQKMRQGVRPRVFKTGDLVRYDPDGSISFISRKDTQVKINGQRTELGEIESQLRRLLPESYTSTVQMVSLADRPTGLLIACIAERTAICAAGSAIDTVQVADLAGHREVEKWWADECFSFSAVQESLARVFPVYMIPKAIFALDPMPLNINGKVNRREISSLLSSMHLREDLEPDAALTSDEALLVQLWEESLQRSLGRVNASANFFDLGGDSLAAIRLASLARRKRLHLTVAGIHVKPMLKDMAEMIASSSFKSISTYQPFSLIIPSLGTQAEVMKKCSQQCGIEVSQIEDMYPCTSYQEHFIAHAIRFPGQCVFQSAFPLRPDIDLDRFRLAVESVVKSHHSLRARLVLINHAWLQVVVEAPIEWKTADSLQSAWDAHTSQPMMAGDVLNRFAIVEDKRTRLSSFVWTSNHAVFDGWSTATFLQHIDRVYSTGALPSLRSSFGELVQHTLTLDIDESRDYWIDHFASIDCKPLCPVLEDPLVDFHWHRQFCPPQSKIPVSLPTAILAAWGLVIGHQTQSNDAVVSLLQLGRDSPIDDIENIVGLVATAFPFRINLDPSIQVHDFVLKTSDRLNQARRFQYTRPEMIRQCSADANRAIDCQTRYVAHPAQFHNASKPEPIISGRSHRVPVKGECIEISLSFTFGGPANAIAMDLTYDSRAIDQEVVQSLMERFELVFVQLVKAPSGKCLKDLSWDPSAILQANPIIKTDLHRADDWIPYPRE
ncbi:hypothetical protein F5B22DRAFT_392567 [Xylaria bambusicola]|uniref:uncharacterized protein n=1 Tax=Xylaria bambusicola TaxID=326684 RepID=UPI002008C8E8|nr:uncharacterized protein F5B22DRAFT_392567 [Xylaria bambusicola]KAI0508575.1 hypothetical protein F5B22DRAFT_392567 [Xylaria bambusicola]